VKKKPFCFHYLRCRWFCRRRNVSPVEADKTDGQWVPASLRAGMGSTTTPGDVMTTDAGVIQYRDFSTVDLVVSLL
jgi:hypothetical protein